MIKIESIAELQQLRSQWQGSVGFVPTMGALHAGHASLIERSKRECSFTVASIFVNPSQFNDPKDLERYPQPLVQDLAILQNLGTDAVFLPKVNEIYRDGFQFEVREKRFSELLCGPRRPGHFAGVLTVVLKLFNLVKPTRAYFGEKDYQQLRLIQEMNEALFLNIEVVPCATVREADGLAMSSRNALLPPNAREKAALIYRALKGSPSAESAAAALQEAGFAVEYVEEHWGRRFVAANLSGVRLIDNVEI